MQVSPGRSSLHTTRVDANSPHFITDYKSRHLATIGTYAGFFVLRAFRCCRFAGDSIYAIVEFDF